MDAIFQDSDVSFDDLGDLEEVQCLMPNGIVLDVLGAR